MNTRYLLSFGLLSFIIFPLKSLAFTDITIADHLYPDTTYLEQHEVFKGYDDGSFGRNRLINRVEALKTILTAAEAEIAEQYDGVKDFSDVPAGIWFEKYVKHSAANGIVSGDADGDTFSPNRNVNKAEFLKMLMLAFEIDPTQYDLSDITIKDTPDEIWFAPYMKFGVKFHIFSLDSNGNGNPGKELTRGEVAQLIFSMLRQGRGLEPQTLLNLAEIHLIKALEFIDKEDIPTASLLVSISEKYATYSLEILPENAIVQSADKIVSSLKSLVGAYASMNSKQYDDAVTNAKQSWQSADESFVLNAANKNLSDKIKSIAASMADKARNQKASSE